MPYKDKKKQSQYTTRYVHQRRILFKQKCVEYLNGKCKICGYNRCINALEFHHRDRIAKRFEINRRIFYTDWEIIKAELDKCDLLCANCHRETEEKIMLTCRNLVDGLVC